METETNPQPESQETPKPPASPKTARTSTRTTAKKSTRRTTPKKSASRPPDAPTPEAKANTVYEPIEMAEDESLSEFYHFHMADPGKQYYIFNPAVERRPPGEVSNPHTMHFLMMRFYRSEKILIPEGKILVICYAPGHPEHPCGCHQFVPNGRIVLARDIKYKHKEREAQSMRDNPGLDEAYNQDVKMIMGKNGVMIEDRNNPFTPGDGSIGEMLPTRADIVAEERRRQEARERMPEEFYEALKKEAEKALGI